MKYEILGSVLALGVVLMLTGSGGLAYFSDVEISSGNSFQAGEWPEAKVFVATPPYSPLKAFIKSLGKRLPVLAYIDLPDGYDEEKIDVARVSLWYGDSFVPAEPLRLGELPRNVVVRTYNETDGSGGRSRFSMKRFGVAPIFDGKWVKFPGEEVAELLRSENGGVEVELRITGVLIDGTYFEGKDNVRVFENWRDFLKYQVESYSASSRSGSRRSGGRPGGSNNPLEALSGHG